MQETYTCMSLVYIYNTHVTHIQEQLCLCINKSNTNSTAVTTWMHWLKWRQQAVVEGCATVHSSSASLPLNCIQKVKWYCGLCECMGAAGRLADKKVRAAFTSCKGQSLNNTGWKSATFILPTVIFHRSVCLTVFQSVQPGRHLTVLKLSQKAKNIQTNIHINQYINCIYISWYYHMDTGELDFNLSDWVSDSLLGTSVFSACASLFRYLLNGCHSSGIALESCLSCAFSLGPYITFFFFLGSVKTYLSR